VSGRPSLELATHAAVGAGAYLAAFAVLARQPVVEALGLRKTAATFDREA